MSYKGILLFLHTIESQFLSTTMFSVLEYYIYYSFELNSKIFHIKNIVLDFIEKVWVGVYDREAEILYVVWFKRIYWNFIQLVLLFIDFQNHKDVKNCQKYYRKYMF